MTEPSKESTKASNQFSTEEKIKEAARRVFHQKGFAGTTTRDIAREAGMNLALLNYYFRGKKKLFEIIMLETVQGFIQSIKHYLNDQDTSIQQKVEILVENYIDLLQREPNIPVFILSEVRNDPSYLIEQVGLREAILGSHFVKQLMEFGDKTGRKMANPLHFLINLLGMTVFPFITKPLLSGVWGMDEKQFKALMDERRILIPRAMKAILEGNAMLAPS